jgi:hypothetical protein
MAVSVGGFDMVREQLAVYSAQGPTDDGRLKPELVAPTNVPSKTYVAKGGRFAGTSASSPHASGLAALLLERYRPASAMQLRTLLLQASSPLGVPNPNMLYGYGHLDAARVRPSMPTPRKSRNLGTETVILSNELGGEVTFTQLERIRETELRQDLFTARITADRTLYQFEDAITVSYSANAPAVCALLHRSGDGTYTALTRETRVDGSGSGSFPPPGQELNATGPADREEFLLICASRPVDLSSVNPDDLLPEIAVARAIFDVVPPFL